MARRQVAELRRAIEGDQRQLVQWAEEKLSLATIALDLVQQHRAAIEADLGALQYELKVPLLGCSLVFLRPY